MSGGVTPRKGPPEPTQPRAPKRIGLHSLSPAPGVQAFSFSGAAAIAPERSSTLAIARASARPRSSGAPGQNPVMKGKRDTRPTDTREADSEPKHFAARIAVPNMIIPHKSGLAKRAAFSTSVEGGAPVAKCSHQARKPSHHR